MRRYAAGCLKVFVLLVIVVVVLGGWWLRGRMTGPYDDYELDMISSADAPAGALEAGVAVRDITPPPSMFDPWTDMDGDQIFTPHVDNYEDRNGNGRFDPLWLAGFEPNRAASGVENPLDARAIALRNNGETIVLVTLDMIGIGHNDVVAIRKAVDPALDIGHIVISATHTHEVPDPIGMWSAPIPFIYFDPSYIEFVRPQVVAAIEAAVAALEPATMTCVQQEVPAEGYVRDSRKPDVRDPDLYAFRFARPGTDETIATLVNWGNHPEALGGKNTRITPDYPYWLRKGMEDGVPEPNGAPGFGGTCLFFQGMVGGLMTQLEMEVPHRDGTRGFEADSFEKAQALGENVAILAAKALRSDAVWANESPELAWSARTIKAPLQPVFRAAVGLGLMHQGYFAGGRAKSEIDVLRIGGVLLLATPGEIYPEIVVGGVEALPGRDYPIEPVEVPPLADAMHGRINLVLGLANDFIGYIIPKSQWDTEAPFVYDGAPQYGEWMSAGPEIAPTVHAACLQLLQEFQAAHPVE